MMSPAEQEFLAAHPAKYAATAALIDDLMAMSRRADSPREQVMTKEHAIEILNATLDDLRGVREAIKPDSVSALAAGGMLCAAVDNAIEDLEALSAAGAFTDGATEADARLLAEFRDTIEAAERQGIDARILLVRKWLELAFGATAGRFLVTHTEVCDLLDMLDAASRSPCMPASMMCAASIVVGGNAFLNSMPEPRGLLCTLQLASP